MLEHQINDILIKHAVEILDHIERNLVRNRAARNPPLCVRLDVREVRDIALEGLQVRFVFLGTAD